MHKAGQGRGRKEQKRIKSSVPSGVFVKREKHRAALSCFVRFKRRSFKVERSKVSLRGLENPSVEARGEERFLLSFLLSAATSPDKKKTLVHLRLPAIKIRRS